MPHLKQIITEELECLCQETSSDFSAVSYRPEQETRLQWRYAFGNRNERYRHMQLKPGLGPGGLTLRTGKPTRWSDRLSYPADLTMECPLMTAELLHAAAAVPIHKGEGIYGVLLVARRSSEAYSDEELAALHKHVQAIQTIFEPA
jgi:nitrogen regulatory protein A